MLRSRIWKSFAECKSGRPISSGFDRFSIELTLPVAHVLSVLHDGQLLVVSCLQFHVSVTAGPVPADQREIQCWGPCEPGMIFFGSGSYFSVSFGSSMKFF